METNTWRPAMAACLRCLTCLACLAACTGGQTGESPADADRQQADCESFDGCPTAEEIAQFGEAFAGGTINFMPAKDLESAVNGDGSIVVLGRLVTVVEGRKEFRARVRRCDDDNYEGPEPCPGTQETLYSNYADLVIRPQETLAGTLDDPDADLRVERHFPSNVPIDAVVRDLRALSPLGARVLVVGNLITDAARENVQPLVDDGIVPPNSIPDNLLWAGPYSLTFEDADGLAHGAASYGENLEDLYAGRMADAGTDVRFDDLLDAVRQATAP